jgi:hypothetical protein
MGLSRAPPGVSRQVREPDHRYLLELRIPDEHRLDVADHAKPG